MNNKKIRSGIFLVCVVFGFGYWIYNKDKLTLTQSTFKGVDEIDTIEAHPEKGIFILGLVRSFGPFGDFDYDLAFEKTDKQNPTNKLRYEVNTGFHFNISKDYIAIDTVKLGKHRQGWFAIQNGKILPDLPDMDHIEDSLKRASDTSVFVQYSQGYIRLYINGKNIKTLNYGNLRTKHVQLNFDSLDHNLYKIQGDSIIVVSKNVDDFFRFKDGVFFIPQPGYGIKYKYDKKFILNYIDSIYRLGLSPSKIKFSPVE